MNKFVEVTKLFQMEKPQVTDKSSRWIFLNMMTEQLIQFDLHKCKSMQIVTKKQQQKNQQPTNPLHIHMRFELVVTNQEKYWDDSRCCHNEHLGSVCNSCEKGKLHFRKY